MKKPALAACALVAGLLLGAAPARSSSRAAPAADTDVGFLDVSSDPSGAKIFIDDVDLGQTTPQHHLPVKPGHHRLVLVTGGGKHSAPVGFTVEAGQTKKLTLYIPG